VVCPVCEQVERSGAVFRQVCRIFGSLFEIAVEHFVEVLNSGTYFRFVEAEEDLGRADIDIDHFGVHSAAQGEL
jgi:hypothetical protein